MTKLAFLVSTVCACSVAIALSGLIIIWVIKNILEWSDDVAYWWKEFKERHSNHKRCK